MFVKICGITNAQDFQMVSEAGADAIGLNFVPGSKRYVTLEEARALVRVPSGRRAKAGDSSRTARQRQAQLWGVFAKPELEWLHQIIDEVGLDCVQLHGGESAEFARLLRQLGVQVVRVQPIGRNPEDRPALPMDLHPADKIVMVDTAVNGHFGGTGQTFDWTQLQRTPLPPGHRLLLAGGLTPGNVAEAVKVARPWGVDVASGVCLAHQPRRKSAKLVHDFIAHARKAEG